MTQTILKSNESNKTEFVNKMFAKIAAKYDLLNNLMTLGLHKKWKEDAIKLALNENIIPRVALDLCSGTGDLAITLHKYSPKTLITCIDNCKEMLNITNEKIKLLKIKNITLSLGDCEKLNYAPSSVDLITIGFGLRNLVNKEECLNSFLKILNNGGIFTCLDIAHPENLIWSTIYNLYFFKIIPILGQSFAKDKEAYTYLPNSLLSWYKQNDLKELILKTGFKRCYYKNIVGGIAAIHIAVK